MRIQHNITALNSYRQLNTNNNNVAKNLEKLSSGYRINRAGDDAAGLAISEKMRAQIKGLETAQKNANDGISLIQTAEGNLQEVHSMLNRMVELATQASNGTYSDSNRAELQKEIRSLNEEIDRIAQSANFNGLKLLDGSLSSPNGIASNITVGDASYSGEAGALGVTKTDGALTAGTPEVKYSASFYFGDITNTDADAKDITFTYKDNNNADKTIKLTTASGKTLTAADVVNALQGKTTGYSDGVTLTADTGVAISDAAHGKFTELYDVSVNGNMITVTAKNDNGTKINGGVINSTKTTGLSITNDFVAADQTAATNKIKQDLNADDTDVNIAYGAIGQSTAYKAKVEGSYQVASTSFTISASATDLHNRALQVGTKTYVFQTDGKEIKGAPEDAIFVKLNSAVDDSAAKIGARLAEAITKSEKDNGGYVASTTAAGNTAASQTGAADGATVTIFESTNRAQDILTNNKTATKAGDVAQLVTLTTAAATSTGSITLDSTKIGEGSSISVGDKNFVLTTGDKRNTGDTIYVKYNAGDDNATLATKLAEAMTDAGVNGVSASADGLNFVATEGNVSAKGAGLTLQVGDTNESFQKVSVSVGNMDAASLGIGDINIGTQTGAALAIDAINSAIDQVSSTRSDLGALQNRLDHTLNNLGVAVENITAAEARIRDTDMAKEMMDFTKNNILTQAAQAMLAQANMVPQSVLQLLQ